MKRLLLLTLGLLVLGVTQVQAQPPNDNCADAIEVFLDTPVSFSTIDATTDGPFHPDSPCPTSASDSIFSDVWFVYTAGFTGSVLWDFCGTTDYDSRIAVYKGGATCPLSDDDLLTCNEDGPAAECPNFESRLTFPVTMGETYLLRVGGFGEEEPGEQGTGTFTLSEAPPAPANDNCEFAQEITLGTGIPVNNINATTDGPDHPGDPACFGFGDETIQSDIWFKFTSPISGFVEWSTCDMVSFDSRMGVYGPDVSCPVQTEDLYACNDDGAGCTNFTSLLIFEVQEGATYLLRLGGFSGEQGQGTMDLVEIIPPEPPANDICETPDTAWVISAESADNFDVIHEGTTIAGSFNQATFQFPPCLTNQSGGEFSDVWFRFNTLGNESLEIRFFRTSDDGEFFVDMFTDCLTPVDTSVIKGSCFAVTNDNPSIIDTITGLPPEPTVYLLRVTTRLTTQLPGDFFFQIVGDMFTDAPEVELPGTLSLQPNPTNQRLWLELQLQEALDPTIQVVNLLGNTVLERQPGLLSPGRHRLQLDVGALPPGVYLLQMRDGHAQKTLKFVKQ